MRVLALEKPWATVGALLMLSLVSAQQPAEKTEPLSADHAAKMARGLDLFKKQVRPILERSCLRCHGGKKIESEFDLNDRSSLLKGGLAGPAIVPGKSKESLLVKLISHVRAPHMPKTGDRLSTEEVAIIASWIDLGAPYDNPLAAASVKKKSWTQKELPPEAKKFWAFQPLQSTPPPAVKNPAWCRTPVDRFILARQESAGLAPNPQADKQHLIRRATFDLLGLPPTPQDVEAFQKDAAPDAYARLLDRLLDSPHYGERWARHWLDLARFAESHGFEHDYDRPTAYHYRDAVIEAFNRDLPFNTFVKWQIAGDEFQPVDPLAVKLTGFLAAGVHSTQITKNEVEKHRYDEMDDQLATLSTALLGLTVGCARCHDHKYDPIPQRDYYRLLASFTTTVRSEVELNLDPKNYEKAKAEFEREHQPFVAAVQNYEAAELPRRLRLWEQSHRADDLPWDILQPTSVASKDGATLAVQPDLSVLATAKNPKFDTYTFVASTKLRRITQVRLEALTHPSLVKGGPGRASNGNFALTDFKVAAAPRSKAGAGASKNIVLKNPRVTFEQKGLPIAATIDKDQKSGWAVDPQIGRDHAAVFEIDKPLEFTDGGVLTFTLKFNNNDGHNLGRLRLSITDAPQPLELRAGGVPEEVRGWLRSAKRSAEQQAEVLRWYRTIEPGWLALHDKEEEHRARAPKPPLIKVLAATEGLPAVRLHTQGEDFLPATYFLRRGDVDNKEGVAPQGFLQVLMPTAESAAHWQKAPPPGWRTSYRRRALAEWLTDTEAGAGQLLARVIVNRLWQHHMGRGIVATPSDFGTRGEPPTHPELLDFLARELIRNGWQLKPIHKLIMTSAVYQESSQPDEAKTKLDRDNKLFWRKPARRLEAEVIRDTLLAVSGTLDPKLYGPGTLDEGSKRRSIYFTVKRSKLVPMMVIFDAPEALGGMAERPTTTIAPQALHLLNNPQVRVYARNFARRIAPDAKTNLETAIQSGYRIALARDPTPAEMADSSAFVNQQIATYADGDRRELGLADFCQVLMCLNEFVYID